MSLRRAHLTAFPVAFRTMTGLTIGAFDTLLDELIPEFHIARQRQLDRRGRRRALGGGDCFDLDPSDRILLTLVWLRHHPTQEALGSLFGVSDSTALRALVACLPLLERSGRAPIREPDPGRGRRRRLAQLKAEIPELAAVLDAFEATGTRLPLS